MSVKRTPPKVTPSSLFNTPTTSYGSDSQLYVSPQGLESGYLDNLSRRLKRKCNDYTDCEQVTILDHMKEMFDSFVQQQNSKFDQLEKSMTTIKEQNTELLNSIDFLSNKYDEILGKMLSLEQKNKSYEQKIESLESRLEHLERNTKASTVEIRNIPKQNSENKTVLRSMVKKVADLIEQPLSDSEVYDIFRLKTTKEANNHIIVNFQTTTIRDGFLGRCRDYNKFHKEDKINTSHLQLSCPVKPIFIDESLTSLGRRLAYMARQIVKDNNFHSTWTSYGKVYLRKTQNSPVLRIDSEVDLQKVLKK